MSGIDPYDPQVSRRNRRLGFILAGVVAAVVIAFIIRFSLAGLPEDYKEWSRIQQRDAGQESADSEEQSETQQSPSREVSQ